jgi:hypothetical protein
MKTTRATTAAVNAAIGRAHALLSFAAQAAEDADLAATTAAAYGDGGEAAAYGAAAAAWAASGDAAARKGAILAPLVEGGRITPARAEEVVNDPAYYPLGDEVLQDEDGVSYSVWGHPVYW